MLYSWEIPGRKTNENVRTKRLLFLTQSYTTVTNLLAKPVKRVSFKELAGADMLNLKI